MRKSYVWAFALIALIALTLAVCATNVVIHPAPVALDEPLNVEVDGDYVHASTGITFPSACGRLTRTSVTQYDRDALDVGATYVLSPGAAREFGPPPALLTLYVYPAQAINETEMRYIELDIKKRWATAELVGSTKYVVESSGTSHRWLRAQYRMEGAGPTGPFKGLTDALLLKIMRRSRPWFVKVRITYLEQDKSAVEAEVEKFVSDLRLSKGG